MAPGARARPRDVSSQPSSIHERSPARPQAQRRRGTPPPHTPGRRHGRALAGTHARRCVARRHGESGVPVPQRYPEVPRSLSSSPLSLYMARMACMLTASAHGTHAMRGHARVPSAGPAASGGGSPPPRVHLPVHLGVASQPSPSPPATPCARTEPNRKGGPAHPRLKGTRRSPSSPVEEPPVRREPSQSPRMVEHPCVRVCGLGSPPSRRGARAGVSWVGASCTTA